MNVSAFCCMRSWNATHPVSSSCQNDVPGLFLSPPFPFLFPFWFVFVFPFFFGAGEIFEELVADSGPEWGQYSAETFWVSNITHWRLQPKLSSQMLWTPDDFLTQSCLWLHIVRSVQKKVLNYGWCQDGAQEWSDWNLRSGTWEPGEMLTSHGIGPYCLWGTYVLAWVLT